METKEDSLINCCSTSQCYTCKQNRITVLKKERKKFSKHAATFFGVGRGQGHFRCYRLKFVLVEEENLV
jgi:hypothetical protein